MKNWTEVHHSVDITYPNDWSLCFQSVTYHYANDRPSEDGYRFIWRRPNGTLQAARGQARIPSPEDLFTLLHRAAEAGWFDTAAAERLLD